MAINITFNGVPLPGVREWAEQVASRVPEITVPRRHGVLVDAAPKRDARIVTLDGRVTAASAAALRTALGTIEAALEAGRGALYLHNDRYLLAVKRDWDLDYYTHACAVDYRLVFVAPDPFWYAVDETAAGTNAITTPSTDVVIDLTGLGNAPALPVFTFTPSGTAGAVKIYNANSHIDTWLQFTGTLSAGTNLVIDCATLTATNAGANCLADITGDFFDLAAGETNTITVTTDAPGNLAYVFRARWY